MKKKKNIIKKIDLNKNFKISYKKELKHYFKESRFKNKFFFKIAFNLKSISMLNKLVKLNRYNILNINKNLIIKRFSYFNYITNSLDLKYNNLCLNLNNFQYIYDFNKKKTVYLNIYSEDLLKYQKFISFIDNNCINYTDLNFDNKDIFNTTNNIYYSFIKNNYILSYLLLLNFKCF